MTMSRTLMILAAATLIAVPQATFAADPVEVTYDDAVKCAALDTTIAIGLNTEDPNATQEDKDDADYLSTMADKWLAQASASNPGGEEATMKDIVDRSTALFLKLADENDTAGKEQLTTDLAACMQLEEAAYGGRNGLVD